MPPFSLSAKIFPTEDPSKIASAMLNLIPDATLTRKSGLITASSTNVEHIVKLVTDQKTRYAFLEAVNSGCSGNSFTVYLNKQAAFVSRVNIVDEPGPLGSIEFSGAVDEPVVFFEKMLDIVGYITSRELRRAERRVEGETGVRS